MKSNLPMPMHRIHRQSGMTLLESLIAVLIFSIGLLALVGMLALSVAAAGEAQYRIEATNHAQSLLQSIRSGVVRSGAGDVDGTDLQRFAHTPTSASATVPCEFTGTPSAHPVVAAWLARIQDVKSGLPGAPGGAAWQQVVVTPTRFNEVRVTLCWKQPADTAVHRHEVIGHIN